MKKIFEKFLRTIRFLRCKRIVTLLQMRHLFVGSQYFASLGCSQRLFMPVSPSRREDITVAHTEEHRR